MHLFLSTVVIVAFFAGGYQTMNMDFKNKDRGIHLATAVIGLVAFLALVLL